MAKKLADQVEKMGQAATNGFRKIENGVVTGFEKVTDKCVDVLFAKEGETTEEAKARLTKNIKKENTHE